MCRSVYGEMNALFGDAKQYKSESIVRWSLGSNRNWRKDEEE